MDLFSILTLAILYSSLFLRSRSRVIDHHGRQENLEPNITATLPGRYEHLNVLELFRFKYDLSLNVICPNEITIMNGPSSLTFNMQIGTGSNSTGTLKCVIENGEKVLAVLQRVQVLPNSSNEALTDIATGEDLENHFPTFFGNFSDHPFKCPILPSPIQTTNVTVRDTGYLYTILSHYISTEIPLGDGFDVLSWADFHSNRNTYSIGLTMVPEVLGCTYLPVEDKKRLIAIVNGIVNGPSAIASPDVLDPSPVSSPSGDLNFGSDPSGSPQGRESPSSQPSPPLLSDGSTCFPRDTRVRLMNGSEIAIKELKVGHMVQDGPNSFSKVILFTHADHDMKSAFIYIKTEYSDLVLTASHLMYINDELLPAGEAKVGDKVRTVSSSGQLEQVFITEISTITGEGLYNPHTMSGNIAVIWKGNAIMTSTYTTAVEPSVGHMLMLPLRILEDAVGGTIPRLSKVFKDGSKFWVGLFRMMGWGGSCMQINGVGERCGLTIV